MSAISVTGKPLPKLSVVHCINVHFRREELLANMVDHSQMKIIKTDS